MQEYMIFYAVFVSQILIISYYYPGKIYRQMKYVFETYPPSAYPKLYPKPIELYERGQRNYRNINLFILIAGFVILALLVAIPHDVDVHNAIAMGYFFAQMFPVVLLDLGSLKDFKLMRNDNTRTTRKAALQPRRFFDFISPALFGIAAITYIGFVLLVVYIEQFGFPWFGGYLNIVIVTAMNVFFLGIMLWHMYGKKLNPYQAYEDRVRQIRTIGKVLTFTSIAATLFGALSISLSAFDIRHLLPIFLSMYFQLLAVIGLQVYRIDHTNFEVYRKDSLVT